MNENVEKINYTKIKYRYFFLSFSLSFLTLSLMFLFLMNMVHPKTPESLLLEPEADATASSYVPAAEDALSVLFIGVTDDNSTAGTFILARFDPIHGKVPIAVFPPETAIQNDGVTESISEVFRYGGSDYTRNALANTIGVPIDRYVKINLDSFILAAAAIGTVEYDLTEPVTVSRGGATITLNRGKQLLDGQKVADVVRYGDYPGGELKRCKIISELTAEIVNQRMDICRSTVVDGVFEKLINLITTDISYTDYYDRKHASEFLARVGNKPALPIEITGSFNDDETLFTLSDTFIALVSQTYR